MQVEVNVQLKVQYLINFVLNISLKGGERNKVVDG